MRNLFWRAVACYLTTPGTDRFLRLLRRGYERPYSPITSADGQDVYMERLWIFNPYGKGEDGEVLPARLQWGFPSIRLHHIRRPDHDRHMHDHPWVSARTIVLKGWYVEERPDGYSYTRMEGYTGLLRFGEYHRISEVSPGGVWTLFFTWKKAGSWGFDVDGQKVPWREYLNPNP